MPDDQMIEEDLSRLPFLCRLGLHARRYHDSSFVRSAARCGRCGNWIDPEQGALVDAERALWSAGPVGESFDEGIVRVSKGLLHV